MFNCILYTYVIVWLLWWKMYWIYYKFISVGNFVSNLGFERLIEAQSVMLAHVKALLQICV
jgi:hypothetical protein